MALLAIWQLTGAGAFCTHAHNARELAEVQFAICKSMPGVENLPCTCLSKQACQPVSKAVRIRSCKSVAQPFSVLQRGMQSI